MIYIEFYLDFKGFVILFKASLTLSLKKITLIDCLEKASLQRETCSKLFIRTVVKGVNLVEI